MLTLTWGPGLGGNPRGLLSGRLSHSLPRRRSAWSGLGFTPDGEPQGRGRGQAWRGLRGARPGAVASGGNRPSLRRRSGRSRRGSGGPRLVSPVHNHGDHTWDEVAKASPDIVPWAPSAGSARGSRWSRLPPSFEGDAVALHKVAEAIVAARKPQDEIALRYTAGASAPLSSQEGGADCQVRVEHGELVRQTGDGGDPRAAPRRGDHRSQGARASSTASPARCSSSSAARRATAIPRSSSYGPSTSTSPSTRLRADGQARHFGASPGDDGPHEPYLYVGPWTQEIPRRALERDGLQGGASSGYSELLAADDQRRPRSTSCRSATGRCKTARADAPARARRPAPARLRLSRPAGGRDRTEGSAGDRGSSAAERPIRRAGPSRSPSSRSAVHLQRLADGADQGADRGALRQGRQAQEHLGARWGPPGSPARSSRREPRSLR